MPGTHESALVVSERSPWRSPRHVLIPEVLPAETSAVRVVPAAVDVIVAVGALGGYAPRSCGGVGLLVDIYG